MTGFFEALLVTRFLPDGYCLQWQSDLIWLHAVSDALIALAYLSIPALLIYFVRRRSDIPFHRMFWAFCLFLVPCGVTHAMNVVTLWYPLPWLSSVLKALAALASVGISIALVRLVPRLLKLPSSSQLAKTNRELGSEIAQRKGAEAALQRAYRQLEAKVELRTAELARASVEKLQSDARFRATFEQAAIGLAQLSTSGAFKEVNERFCAILGYSREELLSMTFHQVTHPDDLETDRAQARTLIAGTARQYSVEKRYIHKDSHEIWAQVTVSLVSSEEKPDYFISAVQDITRRKLAEVLVLESERKYKELANAMPHIVWTAQPDGHSDYFNDRWYEITGLDRSVRYQSWELALHPDDVQMCTEIWYRSMHSETQHEVHLRLRDSRINEFRWYLARAVPVKNSSGAVSRWIGTCTDIHEQKSAEALLELEVRNRTKDLEKSLLEKETLLKEIHHRVKNNLQVISSLLRMQSESLKDENAATALKESQQRVLSMALIHERLYGNNQLAEVDLGDYTHTLVDELFYSWSNGRTTVTSRVEAPRVLLNIDQAIPCGLILNELVTNALKYAYPDGSGGEVRVELREAAENRIRLTVSDHGVGLPEDLDWKSLTSLGLPLVDILTRQLGGVLDFQSRPGATFHLEFPKKQEKTARTASAA